MSNDMKYFGALLEEIRDQNEVFLEGMKDLPTRREFKELKQDVTGLKQVVKIIKAAVTDLSHQVHDHDHQITRLEAA